MSVTKRPHGGALAALASLLLHGAAFALSAEYRAPGSSHPVSSQTAHPLESVAVEVFRDEAAGPLPKVTATHEPAAAVAARAVKMLPQLGSKAAPAAAPSTELSEQAATQPALASALAPATPAPATPAPAPAAPVFKLSLAPAAAAPIGSERPGAEALASRGAAGVSRMPDRPARLLAREPVAYPAAARRAEVEANVLLELTIGADGNVTDARVLRAAGYGFDEAALGAVRRYRFEAATRDGRPARSVLRWTVEFRLR